MKSQKSKLRKLAKKKTRRKNYEKIRNVMHNNVSESRKFPLMPGQGLPKRK